MSAEGEPGRTTDLLPGEHFLQLAYLGMAPTPTNICGLLYSCSLFFEETHLSRPASYVKVETA